MGRPKRFLVVLVALLVLVAGCGGETKALSNTELAGQVSKQLGPDGHGSTLIACYTPKDTGTFNRACYDPLVETSPGDTLYIRVSGKSWCVVWPRAKRAPLCR